MTRLTPKQRFSREGNITPCHRVLGRLSLLDFLHHQIKEDEFQAGNHSYPSHRKQSKQAHGMSYWWRIQKSSGADAEKS
jgi:hypothetical protein